MVGGTLPLARRLDMVTVSYLICTSSLFHMTEPFSVNYYTYMYMYCRTNYFGNRKNFGSQISVTMSLFRFTIVKGGRM